MGEPNLFENLIPIKLEEKCVLTNYGIDKSCISFGTVSLESFHHICIRDVLSQRLLIIDINDASNVIYLNIACESAVINPEKKILALKIVSDLSLTGYTEKVIQIFDVETRTVIKTYSIKNDEDIIYYTWASKKVLSLVSKSSVYHWYLDEANPRKFFDVHVTLKDCRIVSYKTDASLKWSVLVSLYPAGNECVAGRMQLFSVDRQCSQPIDGHSACFTSFKTSSNPEKSNLFAFVNKNTIDKNTKFYISEVGPPNPGNKNFIKKIIDVVSNPFYPNDFPVGLVPDQKYGFIFLLTVHGYINLFDIETGICIFTKRITEDTIFMTTDCEENGGILSVDKKGRVLLVSLDENTIIPYMSNVLKSEKVAMNFVKRNKNLRGSESVFVESFERLYNSGKYKEAAAVAIEAPNDILRSPNTLQMFQNATHNNADKSGLQISPILQYFGSLLDSGNKMNAHESMEITKRVLNQGRKDLLEKWMIQDKIYCTEVLGDVVRKFDPILALSVYLRANIPAKVTSCFVESKQFDKIILYCKKVGYTPNRVKLVEEAVNLCDNNSNLDETVDFAKSLIKEIDNNVQLNNDISGITDVYMKRNLVKQCTAFLLDILKDDKPDQGSLQTKLIEINISFGAVQIVDAILGNKMFSFYDKSYVGHLCENAGLLQRALENYSDLFDIKRVVIHTNKLNEDWLVDYFSNLSAEDAMECLKTMLTTDIRLSFQVCVKICIKYYKQLKIDAVVTLFENIKCFEGLYIFLGSIINTYNIKDKNVYFKYIQSACKTGQIKELERICKESNHYNPEKVKHYLKEIKLSDQIPLIIVCDRFNYIKDLILYLYRNNLHNYIEMYVQKINQSRLPEVVGNLIDIDCNEETIKNLIMSTRNTQFLPEKLVEEVEKRGRLKFLLPWLEMRINEGRTDAATHNAMAKICIECNNNPERFLKENQYYDSITIGKFCEKRDVNLACLAYERGKCDEAYINICYENSLFKMAARYLVRRCDTNLWNRVLMPDFVPGTFNQDFVYGCDYDDCRRQMIDQVVQTALSETHDPEEISTTVKAFMTADMPNELIEVLEKIVLNKAIFGNHKNLQNLLILTAIKCDKNRVIDYIQRLDKYDVKDVANICINNELYEEALEIYKKFNHNVLAAKVLIENIKNLDRAYEFAELCNEPTVWSLLGKALLDNNFVKGGIDSFIKANDPNSYVEVVEIAKKAEIWADLVNFLQMAFRNTREPFVESELIYAYAKTNRLADLEEFISTPNNADIHMIGDRCFDNEMYESAKILYENISDYAKLSLTMAKMKSFQDAVDNARKANCIKTWKNLCNICLEHHEYRLAQICGLNIVVDAEELHSLVDHYLIEGHVIEIIELLETSLGLERTHMGIFTELSILYAKFQPEKLKENVELFWHRINIPKVLKAANEAHLWPVTVFLYEKYEDFDNAVMTMMEHPTETWKENQFKDMITKICNSELYYKAIHFYIEYKPMSINELLIVLSPRVDQSKVINIFLDAGLINLIKTYLTIVQGYNNKYINQVLNDIYIDEDDYQNLQSSINLYNNFDSIVLAQKLEKHDLIEFRRISAYLYKNSNRWKKSLEICKEEHLYKDAMKYAAESKDPNLSVELLDWFLQKNLPDHFAACLFQCYDLLQPDVVLELSWKYKILDFTMPYFVQVMHEYICKIDQMVKTQQQNQTSEDDLKNTSSESEVNNLQLMIATQSGEINFVQDAITELALTDDFTTHNINGDQ